MDSKYELAFKVPCGSATVQAENMDNLIQCTHELCSISLPSVFGDKKSEAAKAKQKASVICQALIVLDGQEGKNASRSKVSRAGLDYEVIDCYLKNMTIDEIAKYIKKKKKVNLSRSAIGRYTARLPKALGLSMKLTESTNFNR